MKLVNAAYDIHSSAPDQSLQISSAALKLATSLHWEKGEGLAYNELGNSYQNLGDYPRALDHFYKALHIHEMNGDSLHTGITIGNIGTSYFFQKRYDKALMYFSRALSLSRFSKDKTEEIAMLGNIGSVYYRLGDYPKSETYMIQAYRLAEEFKDSTGMINQLSNLANIYAETGALQASLDASFKTLAIAQKMGNKMLVAANTGNIGETYLDMWNDSARKLSPVKRKALLEQAVSFLNQGIEKGRDLGYRDAVLDFLKTLSQAYAAQHDYGKALSTYQQYISLRDSTFNLVNNEKIAALENKRVIQLKDRDLLIAQIELKQKLRQRWFYLGGLVLLFAIVILLWRGISRQRRSNLLLAREKNRSESLLRNILPDEIAEELKEKGRAEARQYEAVTVLFTDFVNFTHAAQNMQAKELVQELHECFSAFDRIMEQYGLEKIKTIGDAYMAVCGMPNLCPDHALRVVDAAREILRYIETRSLTKASFAVRIGVHSGPVIAGIVGTKKFAFDIWGDTVNTAARMEQHGVPGSINISHNTFELVKGKYHCAYRGRVEAKHKGEVEMYLVQEPVQA